MEILGGFHIDTLLKANMIKFYEKAVTHEKHIIRVASNSLIRKRNTVMGINAALLLNELKQLNIIKSNSNILDINMALYKKLKFFELTSEDDFSKKEGDPA